jgi:hypothetical protein
MRKEFFTKVRIGLAALRVAAVAPAADLAMSANLHALTGTHQCVP